MSEFAGNIPRKFISFRHLRVESNADKLPEERESENPQNVSESREVNTLEIGETSASPAKVMSVLQNVPVSSGDVESGRVQEDLGLTIAEKDCVLTSSEEDMEDLNAFVKKKLQLMTEKGLEQLVGNESMNVEEILSGNLAAVSSQIVESGGIVGPEVDQGRTASVCPKLTSSADVEGSRCEVFSRGRDNLDRKL